MTAEVAIRDTDEDRNHKRQLAILKATGLDRLPNEQRELTLAISRKYELDLMLRHLVTIDGKPYITRDGLLHVAHRSGQLDGIETTDPVLVDGFWRSTCSVFRKDMSHAFTYTGRYPESGKNKSFAPEMATKVGEVMSLRRAFDVSAPVAEERWDVDVPAAEPEQPKTLAEKVAEKAAAVETPIEQDATAIVAEVFDGDIVEEGASPLEQAIAAMPAEAEKKPAKAKIEPIVMVQCESQSPFSEGVQCRREAGHPGAHRTDSESWTA